jgi:hypothetical protein
MSSLFVLIYGTLKVHITISSSFLVVTRVFVMLAEIIECSNQSYLLFSFSFLFFYLRMAKEKNFWLRNRKFGFMVKCRMNPFKQSLSKYVFRGLKVISKIPSLLSKKSRATISIK